MSVYYVITEDNDNEVLGYYTLSSAVIEKSDVPETYNKLSKAPYGQLPVFIIGRLAIHTKCQGQGLGGATLISAFKKSLQIKEQIGCCAIVVDPIDQNAQQFYQKYQFIKLASSDRMILPIATIEQLLKDVNESQR